MPETAVQMAKNLQNLSSDHPLKCEELVIDAVGITKGCVNIQTAMLGYPEFAYNNTHDVRHASEAEYESALNNYTMPGGCRDLIEECRAAGMEGIQRFLAPTQLSMNCVWKLLTSARNTSLEVFLP